MKPESKKPFSFSKVSLSSLITLLALLQCNRPTDSLTGVPLLIHLHNFSICFSVSSCLPFKFPLDPLIGLFEQQCHALRQEKLAGWRMLLQLQICLKLYLPESTFLLALLHLNFHLLALLISDMSSTLPFRFTIWVICASCSILGYIFVYFVLGCTSCLCAESLSIFIT